MAEQRDGAEKVMELYRKLQDACENYVFCEIMAAIGALAAEVLVEYVSEENLSSAQNKLIDDIRFICSACRRPAK